MGDFNLSPDHSAWGPLKEVAQPYHHRLVVTGPGVLHFPSRSGSTMSRPAAPYRIMLRSTSCLMGHGCGMPRPLLPAGAITTASIDTIALCYSYIGERARDE